MPAQLRPACARAMAKESVRTRYARFLVINTTLCCVMFFANYEYNYLESSESMYDIGLLFEWIFLGGGLAMDAFAVSV